MGEWQDLVAGEQEKLDEILKTEDGMRLRELAWQDFRQTAEWVNRDVAAPFIVWPAINRQPYQAWLPVLLMQLVRLRIKEWLGEFREVMVFGVPSSGSWYGEVLRRVKVLEEDGWRVSYPRVEKLKQLKQVPKGSWQVAVPSYVHQRQGDGSRGKEVMVVFEPESWQGKLVVALDDAIAEGLTLSYLGRGLKEELGVGKLVVAGAMAKEMQGGKERLQGDWAIDEVVSLVDVTKEVLDDLDR